jgi:hypothetical protein
VTCPSMQPTGNDTLAGAVIEHAYCESGESGVRCLVVLVAVRSSGLGVETGTVQVLYVVLYGAL